MCPVQTAPGGQTPTHWGVKSPPRPATVPLVQKLSNLHFMSPDPIPHYFSFPPSNWKFFSKLQLHFSHSDEQTIRQSQETSFLISGWLSLLLPAPRPPWVCLGQVPRDAPTSHPADPSPQPPASPAGHQRGIALTPSLVPEPSACPSGLPCLALLTLAFPPAFLFAPTRVLSLLPCAPRA